MSDILVFSPPVSEGDPQPCEIYSLGEVCGWLRDEGYSFDQRSLFAECRFLNRFRFSRDFVDLSVFEPSRVIDYLRGGEDEGISREANKMADILSIDSYDTVIVPLRTDQVISIRDARLLMALPILKERAHEKLTILGGASMPESMELPRLDFVDYAVDGDVELPLKNIFEHEFNEEPLEVEPGVMCVRGGELLRGTRYQHPMDAKPKPYFDPEILEKHAKTTALGFSIIPYQLGRGCSQDCSFCTFFEDQRYQYKSVDKVVRELRELKQETGTRHVRFADENLFNDPDHLRELAERIRDSDLEISWGGLGIIISRSQEFFDTLAEGGCKTLYHGIESASDSVLHRMRKHQTRETIEKTLEKEHRAGINPFAGFITDYVDESWDEYFETVDFIRKNRHLMGAEATSLRIYPSERQPLYREPEKFGIEIEEDGGEEDWLDLVPDYNLSFRDSRGEVGRVKNDTREFKENYLQKRMDVNLTLRNFGLRHPAAFLRLQLRKLYMKDYSDITYAYA